jgi:hypothetical protein
MPFYNGFIAFLKGKNYVPNMLGCIIKTVKKFLKDNYELHSPLISFRG